MERGYGAQDVPVGRWYRHPNTGELVHQFVGAKLAGELEAKGFVFVGLGEADAPPAEAEGAEEETEGAE